MLSTVFLGMSYATSVTFIHLTIYIVSLPDFVTTCSHTLMTVLAFALLAHVVVLVFTFCGLSSGRERVHPSLLIAMWVQNHGPAP